MYRKLEGQEIEVLANRGCTADSWNNVKVKDPFIPDRYLNVRFSGSVKLGSGNGQVEIYPGYFRDSGIFNANIHNCTIGDNTFISNAGCLANYKIGSHVIIEDVGALVVSGETTFGNGHKIDILNEGGGRELPIFDKLSAQIAYLMVVYRHNSKFTENLGDMISRYTETLRSSAGEIGDGARISHTGTIQNVNIGAHSVIRGASMLKEGTIVSRQEAPVIIGENVTANRFIVLSGSVIDSGAIISSSFIGQGVQIGKQFSSENSAFFANCEAFHGEACSVFAGPYTVTHHKSTLLIAGMFSFFNAGSGTNQSNHMYKLGPVHQGIIERGSKTGSFSYMLWPCRVGAFSVVMDKHAGNFDTAELPYSYITVEGEKVF
jgi:carbonic anhydrase/acetyltransferase-like protein (isoleucine patch superfamily)